VVICCRVLSRCNLCALLENTGGGWVPFWVSPVHRKRRGGSRFEYQVGPTFSVKNNRLHIEDLLYTRLNFFLIFESVLLAVVGA
jgi:hypothetical protein